MGRRTPGVAFAGGGSLRTLQLPGIAGSTVPHGTKMKKATLIYLGLLTVLLVVRNPLDLFGRQEYVVEAFRLLGFIVHFLTFSLLGWLMLASRWMVRGEVLFAGLVIYAALTELVQFAIPGRSPALFDFAQDVAGLAVGALVWWASQRFFVRHVDWRESSY